MHFARNLLAHVPKTHTHMVAAVFRTILWQSDERRFLSEGSMAQLSPTSDTDTTAAIDSGA